MTDFVNFKRLAANPLSDLPDQLLFFGLFIVGTAAIWTTKVLGLSQFMVTAIALALMALYGVIAVVTKRYRLREDKVGDNIYYLGFLFTLVSLAYALYAYDTSGSGATVVITNFGIAISTTIIGLAGRVLFNQMREDPIEYEREARYSLGEAARELRAQLSDITTDLSQFKRNIVQIAQEGVVDVTESAKQSMTEGASKFAASAQEVMTTIELAFSEFTDHSSKLNAIAGKNVEALQALFERIEHIEASPDLLAAKLAPIVDKFAELADEAARRNRGQTNDLKRLRDSVETAIGASEQLRESISKMDGATSAHLATLANGYKDIHDKAAAFIGKLETTGNVVAGDVEKAHRQSLDLVSLFEQQSNAIARLHEDVEEDVDIIQRHRDDLARLADESRQSVEAVQTGLVSLTKTVVEQLNGQ